MDTRTPYVRELHTRFQNEYDEAYALLVPFGNFYYKTSKLLVNPYFVSVNLYFSVDTKKAEYVLTGDGAAGVRGAQLTEFAAKVNDYLSKNPKLVNWLCRESAFPSDDDGPRQVQLHIQRPRIVKDMSVPEPKNSSLKDHLNYYSFGTGNYLNFFVGHSDRWYTVKHDSFSLNRSFTIRLWATPPPSKFHYMTTKAGIYDSFGNLIKYEHFGMLKSYYFAHEETDPFRSIGFEEELRRFSNNTGIDLLNPEESDLLFIDLFLSGLRLPQ